MKMRRKGLRRIAFLLVILIAVGIAGSVIAYRQRGARNAQLDVDRKLGMQAAREGDYSKAIEPLERYLRERDEDNEAAIFYADARHRVELTSGQHLSRAIEKLDGVLKRDPNNLAAKHLLLDIYPQATNTTDSLERIADDVLAKDPADSLALRGMITARVRQNRLPEALVYARQYAQIRTDDLQSKMLVMQLMKTLKTPTTDIQQYADGQFGGNATDARFLVLQAWAANYANDGDRAIKCLQQAAAMPANDASLVRLLAGLFDQLKRFDDSREVLERAAAAGDPEILQILITRLWQAGQFEQIISRLASLDPANRKTDIELIAMTALAHFELNQPAAARKLVEHLRVRKDAQKAKAWVAALDSLFSTDKPTPLATATRLSKEAIARDPENGIFRSWLGDAYWSLGESSLALQQWSAAAQSLPSWSRPYIAMSQALIQLGRTAEAVDAAREAYARSPITSSAINLAVVRFRLVEETGDQAGADELLKVVRQVQATMPGEPNTLPIGVSLLARSGQRDEAVAMLDKCIATPGKLDVETLIKLTAVSRAEGLDREEALLASIPDDAVTPRLALTRATLLADSGKQADGLVLLEKSANVGTGDRVAWALATAQYLDAVGANGAADAWRSLGDSNPHSLEVQRAILAGSPSLRADRPFIEKTITRLKEITGPDAQQWKIERARWLIDSPLVMKDCVEAVTILTDVVRDSPRQIEPRLQLAKALERTGNVATAIEHLRAAQKIDPRSASVTLELVRILQNQGSTDQVRDVLRQMSATAMTTAQQRVMLASMYADVGDSKRAIALLEPDEKRRALSPPGRLLLADLYRRGSRIAESQTIFDSLLASKNPSTSALAAAAEFYATQNQMPKAREILARLAPTESQNPEAWIARARFEVRFGDRDAALALFRRAADSGTEQGCVEFIDYLMDIKDFSHASTVARAAQQKLPGSEAINNRVLEAEARLQHRTDPKNLQPLINALSRDPSRAAEVEMLKTLDGIRTNKLTSVENIARLRTLADKYPRLLPLQEQMIDLYLQQRRIEDAVLIAQRTMESLPTEPTAAALAVRTLRSAGRWGEMRVAAEQWKHRSSDTTIDADTAIAEALIELDKPDEAQRQLEPYLASIESDVRTQPQAAVVLARTMLLRKAGADARKLIEPLLKDASGRRLCLGVAVRADTLEEASAWMDQIRSASDKDNLDESLQIATTWTQIARRFDDRATLAAIPSQLDGYLRTRSQDTDAWMLIAGIHQQLGQLDLAETELRTVLAITPEHPAAANDLACLLLASGKGIKEAETLARSAVKQNPAAAAFHDTLARVLMEQKQFDDARAGFEQALRLNPELIDARIGLARLLHAKGDTEAALRELQRVNVQVKTNPNAGRHLESEITALRDALSRVDH